MASEKEKPDYPKLAANIIELVGGEGNVVSLRHCMTRCRFKLRDESLAKTDEIKELDGVITVVSNGGEYMVVIGNEVVDVYDALMAQLKLGDDELTDAAQDADADKGKDNLFTTALNDIMAAIVPSLNMICAGGIIKGLLAVLTMAGLSDASGWFMLLSALGDAVFYFLPIMLGMNLAQYLKGDPHLGLIIGAAMCYPSIQGVDIELFGFVVNASYTTSLLPVILVTALAVPYQRQYKK